MLPEKIHKFLTTELGNVLDAILFIIIITSHLTGGVQIFLGGGC